MTSPINDHSINKPSNNANTTPLTCTVPLCRIWRTNYARDPEKIPQESVATPSNWAVANLTRILSAMLQTRTILAAALSVAYMERVDVCALGYGVTLTDPTT